jgi:FtsH-binding integral membrane protein
MPDEFPLKDPKKIWQDQPTEPIKMSLEEVRRKAQNFQTKSRLKVLAAMVIGLFLCIAFARMAAVVEEMIPRIGWGMMSLYGLYGAYAAYRWMWPRRLAEDATLSTSLDFYRSELERKRDYERHIWRRSGLTFCFAGVALALIPELIPALKTPRLLLNAAPFFVLLVIWFVLFFFIRKRNRLKLQREIDELNDLERN